MSSLTRSKPSFIIYRDEPTAPEPAQSATATSTTAPSVTSQRPTLSTSLSFHDKENTSPYPTVGTNDKPKLKSKTSTTGRSIKSAPTSPIVSENADGATAIRLALATKFVASSSKKNKPKLQSSNSVRRSATIASSSSSENAPPKLKRSLSTSSTSRLGEKKHKLSSRGLASTVETIPEHVESSQCGSDGLTMADRRARDLTILPLADISEAFPTGAAPEGFAPPSSPSRKRTRAHSINARDTEPSSPQAEAGLSQATSTDATEETAQAAAEAAPSPSSPHKRVRLSPVSEPVPLPALASEPTLVDPFVEQATAEPTTVDES